MNRNIPENIPAFGVIEIKLSDSLWSAFSASVRRQGLTMDVAVTRLIDGLHGLTRGDLSELVEPPREKVNRICTYRIEQHRKHLIEHFSFTTGFSYHTVLRRILYALVVSKEIAFFNSQTEPGMQLRRTQMRFDFAEDYERDGATPLLTRQHRWTA